jgi:hypothetical protein
MYNAQYNQVCLSTEDSVRGGKVILCEKDCRRFYLDRLGFTTNSDPFISPVAEHEMDLVENIEQFFAYYAPPQTHNNQSLSIDVMRKMQHTFIYGNPGDGKTMLRYALDTSCRIQPDTTLTVNYVFNKSPTRPLSETEHGNLLIQSFAIDFVLRIIELSAQQSHLDAWWEDKTRIESLARQIQWGGEKLKRFIRSVLAHSREHNKSSNISDYWKQVNRFPVQVIVLNEPFIHILERAIQLSEKASLAPKGFEGLIQSVDDANRFGLRQVFILVDRLDNRLRSENEMFALILPLLKRIAPDTASRIYYKFFIPLELKAQIDEWCHKNIPPGLYSNCLNATINWTQPALKQLLIQRFHASGSRLLTSLDDLAESSLEMGLEQPIIELSHGSPRRMLELISALIQAHAERAPDQIEIAPVDYERMKSAA